MSSDIIGDGFSLGKVYDNILNSLVVGDFINCAVLEEKVFSISKRFTLGGSATDNIWVNTTAHTTGKIIILPLRFEGIGGGPINIDLYLGPTVTPLTGTLWEPINRENSSSSVADIEVRYNPTITNDGIKSPTEFQIQSNGAGSAIKIGAASLDSLLFVARSDLSYLLKFSNQSASDLNMTAAFSWIEL